MWTVVGIVTTGVWYDAADEAWVASLNGKELDRNHQLDPTEDLAARQWLAWLTDARMPLSPGEKRVLAEVAQESGIGVGTPYATILAQLLGRPGYRTDAYTQWNVGWMYATACTSLTDAQALARARTCPSGTSGGWTRSNRQEPEPCKEQPATHRHILLEAG